MGALIPIAIQLAQYAPAIMRYFGADASAAVADKVVDVAQVVTGCKTPEEALEAIKANQALQIAFQEKVMDIEADLTKAYLGDIQDARKRDTAMQTSGHRNFRADLMTVGAFAVVLVIAYKVWTSPDINDYAKGIITLVLGRFLGYTDQIFQFEFGAVRNTTFGGKK